jgi:hypothetical protein
MRCCIASSTTSRLRDQYDSAPGPFYRMLALGSSGITLSSDAEAALPCGNAALWSSRECPGTSRTVLSEATVTGAYAHRVGCYTFLRSSEIYACRAGRLCVSRTQARYRRLPTPSQKLAALPDKCGKAGAITTAKVNGLFGLRYVF